MKLNRSGRSTKRTLAISAIVLLAALTAGFTASRADAASYTCRAYAQTQRGPFAGTVTASTHTSCPFARAVFGASLRRIVAAGGVGNGSFSTRAYSPVTRRWYRVRCDANGSLYTNERMKVDCRAGLGARIAFLA